MAHPQSEHTHLKSDPSLLLRFIDVVVTHIVETQKDIKEDKNFSDAYMQGKYDALEDIFIHLVPIEKNRESIRQVYLL